MKILFASDSFKGSLTSEEIIGILTRVSRKIFPDAETEGMLVADGGEGTMAAVVQECKGNHRTVVVKGPLGEPVSASYGILPGGKAIIEMAEASGLPLVSPEKRNPLKTSSYGTGMLIRDALDQGIRNVIVAIGGSASNDGGMGAMAALGVRFLDQENTELKGCGADLERVCRIDLSGIHPAVSETSFTVMCDVTNPLLGSQGASYTFGKQKGADEEMLEKLEAGMMHYAEIAEKTMSREVRMAEGAGAAGGLGFAMMLFLNARLQSGIETVLDLIQFDSKLKGADLVVTGEGRMDWQSCFGKVPSGIGKRCKKAGVPVVAIVGGLLDGYQEIYECGISGIVTSVNGIMELEEALQNSEHLYEDAASRLFRMLKCGMQMQQKQADWKEKR